MTVDAYKNSARGELQTQLGHAVEDYVEYLLAKTSRVDEQSWKRLSVSRGKYADFSVRDKSSEAIIEVTTAWLPLGSKISQDPNSLAILFQRLDKEYDQIAFSIKKVLDSSDAPPRVFPVLIGLDRALSTFGLQKTLENRFRARAVSIVGAAARNIFTIPRLITMSMEDFECCVAVMKQNNCTFRFLLESYLAVDENGTSNVKNALFSKGLMKDLPPPDFESHLKLVDEHYRQVLSD